MMELIKIRTANGGEFVFQVVKEVPLGYSIWNIGDNAPKGYLPLCRVCGGGYSVDVYSLRAIKVGEVAAKQILKAVSQGYNTLGKLEGVLYGGHEVGNEEYKICVKAYNQLQRVKGAKYLSGD